MIRPTPISDPFALTTPGIGSPAIHSGSATTANHTAFHTISNSITGRKANGRNMPPIANTARANSSECHTPRHGVQSEEPSKI